MTTTVLGVRVDGVSYGEALGRILGWARQGESRTVCVANVHMIMEAYDSAEFKEALRSADLVVPDGMPLVWMLRAKGRHEQERVYGPELMIQMIRSAAATHLAVGLLGGTERTLQLLSDELRRRCPGINIVYSWSPPFRVLDAAEDEGLVAQIAESGCRILFIGLGCPKQELWMAAHHDRVAAVMVGVGAAFDFIAGSKPQAPAWMQRAGLEWLFRLLTEPARLWRRYLWHNPRFTILAAAELARLRRL